MEHVCRETLYCLKCDQYFCSGCLGDKPMCLSCMGGLRRVDPSTPRCPHPDNLCNADGTCLLCGAGAQPPEGEKSEGVRWES